jgi:hypothetical protein
LTTGRLTAARLTATGLSRTPRLASASRIPAGTAGTGLACGPAGVITGACVTERATATTGGCFAAGRVGRAA